jgi:hypothetical protein
MKISELVQGFEESPRNEKVYNIIDEFEVWTTLEESELLKKLKQPTRLSKLTEHEQFTIQAMIRKSLVTKIGMTDPMVVANEKNNEENQY